MKKEELRDGRYIHPIMRYRCRKLATNRLIMPKSARAFIREDGVA